MTGKEFADLIRYHTRTDTVTLTDAEIVLLANARLETMARGIMGTDEDILVLPHTTSLLTGIREYPFPANLLSRIKYVEAKLDGTNWIVLTEFDINQNRRPTSETDILNAYSNYDGHAFYDIDRKALRLYCGAITTVVAGLKVWCNTYPAKMTTDKLSNTETDLSTDPTATTHGTPQELHELWMRGVCIDYKGAKEKPIPLTEKEQMWLLDYQLAIQDLKHGDTSREVFAELPPAMSRWNNGQDL